MQATDTSLEQEIFSSNQLANPEANASTPDAVIATPGVTQPTRAANFFGRLSRTGTKAKSVPILPETDALMNAAAGYANKSVHINALVTQGMAAGKMLEHKLGGPFKRSLKDGFNGILFSDLVALYGKEGAERCAEAIAWSKVSTGQIWDAEAFKRT